ncbi:hypothetical protein DM860_010607 [Cuscuta australis]|uniref:Response regulatory domain-containing protein n=1 Tax=Cuscuta australis TaxID=267555 RepID=A0A328E5K9_9ASTE|nr:hypothetical protein DM860_010607 [Cuscuta australis]
MGMAAADPQFHVLAVDDSLIDRKLVERLFKTSSCQVTAVDSGLKALEFLGLLENDQNRPTQPSVLPNHTNQEMEVNLIITDYCMPGMTGYDLLKKIKESAALRNIPVVIMSSENVPSRINRCLEEGAEEFFLKPVRLSDVDKLIKPRMMKARCEKQHKPEIDDDTQALENSDQDSSPEDESSVITQLLPIITQLHPLRQTDETNDNNNNSNKRKVWEESNRPRTRTKGPDTDQDQVTEWEEHVVACNQIVANTLLG